ncbi:MAG: oxygenase MpaB family protein [Acidimicrobiales bacterium]
MADPPTKAPDLDRAPLDDPRLAELRQVGDPEADRLAARLLAEHPNLDERHLVRLVLDELRADGNGNDGLVRDWLFEGPPLPEWADRKLIERGQDFFGDWPLPIAAALFCVALPGAYAAADGSRVLTMTSDLATKDLSRRAVETGQMLFDVMDLGGRSPAPLEPDGPGYLTIRGIRLLHGVVRQNLLSLDSASLNPDAPALSWSPLWGCPVNQEDLLGTLLTFGVVVLHGLDRLGIPYDRCAAEAYVHTWCVIGDLIGIQPDLLPFDREEGERLARLIAERHHRRSEDGRRLTAALLDYMELSMPLGFRKLPCTLMQHMLPAPTPELLDVPRAAWWHPAIGVMARAGPWLDRIPGGRTLVQVPTSLLGRAVLRAVVDRTLDGAQPAFRLDPKVVARLSLRTSRVRRTLRRRRRRIRRVRRVRRIQVER